MPTIPLPKTGFRSIHSGRPADRRPRAARWLPIKLLLLVGLGGTGAATAQITNLTFTQADFEQGAFVQPDSSWGAVTVEFVGATDFQYFNLVIDGNWQIRNAPLWSSEGSGVPHAITLTFDLGVLPGTNVTSLDYVADLSPVPSGSPPMRVSTPAPVGDRPVTVGGRGGPLPPMGPPAPIQQPPSATIVDSAFHFGMVNQECGVDECVPAAFSNSLNWLDNENDDLNIPADKKSIGGLKGPTNWSPPDTYPPGHPQEGEPIPGTGGTPVDGSDWQGKRDALAGHVTTRMFTMAEIDGVIDELEDGQDVELFGPHHGAVVTGIVKFSDGDYVIEVAHDTAQGQAGGTEEQMLVYDSDTGLVTAGVFGIDAGAGLDWFVVECPDRRSLEAPGTDPTIPMSDPTGPWHELWPEYCTPWTCDEWRDNGSGVLDYCDYLHMVNDNTGDSTWYHVENVTATLTLTPWVLSEPTYLDLMADEVPPALENPLGTLWHEVYPEYCNEYVCVDWADNGDGVVSYCDYLVMQQLGTGLLVTYHVEDVATDIDVTAGEPPPDDMNLDRPGSDPSVPLPDPLGPWHELWPDFCTPWTCDEWVDNGSGVVDFCDYLHLVNDSTGAGEWYHVENVTATLALTALTPRSEPTYLDYLGDDPVAGLEDPVGTWWHELYPAYCNDYICVAWMDNGDGVVSFCDYLVMEHLGTGDLTTYHVENVATDIDVVRQAPPDAMNLDRPGSDPSVPLPDPLGPWHELWPDFCTPWTCDEWVDNGSGVVDVCDYLHMVNDLTGETIWYHVENVTATLTLTPMPARSEPTFVDYVGADPAGSLLDPVGTLWHEVYPVYCRYSVCEAWQDNGDGVVSFCDYLLMRDLATNELHWYHVEALATDIDIIREEPPVTVCRGDSNCDGVINWRDIDFFVAAMNDNVAAWSAMFPPPGPPCDFANNDVNADGSVSWRDIDPLVAVMNTVCP